MANKSFDSMEALYAGVNDAIKNIAKYDVAPVAKNILKKNIKERIYDAYAPKKNGWITTTSSGKKIRTTYHRRRDLDKSVNDIIFQGTGNVTTLSISSSAVPSKPVKGGYVSNKRGSLLNLLGQSKLGVWKGGFPRPVLDPTQAEFKKSAEIDSAIRTGIQKRIEN